MHRQYVDTVAKFVAQTSKTAAQQVETFESTLYEMIDKKVEEMAARMEQDGMWRPSETLKVTMADMIKRAVNERD